MNETRFHAELASRTVIVASIALGFVVILLGFYFAAPAIFTIFGGLLLAAIFDGISRPLRKLGLTRSLALALVFILTLALLAIVLLGGGAAVIWQAGDLARAVQSQASDLLDQLRQWGLPVEPLEGGADLESLLPEPQGVVSSASTALFSLVGGLGNVFIIIFLGAFVAWQPELYRNGLVSLFPRTKRNRIRDTLDDSAHALRMWLVGSAISMATVFVVSWIGLWLIGMPYAFLLSLQAGILAFIPTLGPFVAGIPIILTGLSDSPTMALWGLGVYLLIQGVESNVTTPIAQRWTTSLPPALTLGFQLVLGILFGLPGLILAVPILAVLLTIVNNLYVDDVLGGAYEPSARG